MGLNFRKSIQLIPGVKLNLSKSGASISAGVPGFRKSINTQGQVTTTASIPGTGLYYTDKKKAFGKDAKTAKKAAEKQAAEKKTTKKSTPTAEKRRQRKKPLLPPRKRQRQRQQPKNQRRKRRRHPLRPHPSASRSRPHPYIRTSDRSTPRRSNRYTRQPTTRSTGRRSQRPQRRPTRPAVR